MKYQEFIESHTVAADYRENKNGKCETVQMVSVENAEKACKLAEYNLATELLELHESARIEFLEKIVHNFERRK